MPTTSLAQQIKSQEKAIADSKKKIADLKKKAIDKQSKRFLKAADKAGLFLVEVSDKNLNAAMVNLVKTADSPSAVSEPNSSKTATASEQATV